MARAVHSWRIKTDAQATADELGLLYRGLLAGDAVEISAVCACSTVPAALRALRTMLGRYYSTVPSLIVEAGVRTGVQLAIDNPKEVGTDRVVNTLAAYTIYGGPSIVVDIGTTMTFDVIASGASSVARSHPESRSRPTRLPPGRPVAQEPAKPRQHGKNTVSVFSPACTTATPGSWTASWSG
jgi:hypothetical protein